ncbi:ABC transporter ATP-binding protein [Oleisolibacter albus]|uniref:ABC transporter ATP-binding protein n=1 Tax=Oleisolibacter albus TaxID=2171757 RepID=UPI00195FAB4B|nr:ABC transporter ATP-binding protein [Oleisolibacter albus]
MLETLDLAYGYPGRTLGSGITLSLEPGEVLCLLGPNGSGKTTLFKTLLGLLPPLGGQVRLGGADLAGLPRRAVARRIAFLPQSHTVHFPYRVRDVVLMGRAAQIGLFATPAAADRAAADAALESVGIAHLAGRSYAEVSGGERQLALVARALAQGAPVLVMDEPTASLDFGNQVRVLQRVRQLRDAGHSIVLSTHDPAQAHALADRVALLRPGGLAALGPPARVATAQALAALYGVPVAVERLAAAGTVAVVPRL